ncbi:hypothetical protein Y032_0143g2358 [Ancylostoma ceylanicum]|uniref:Uncharacterized protein n=1 Tax=Ancylostoma ceylanicum TaxID=53326 RepID=A0A016T311_9BILA|nr:hypothetical protein Y032_0143g2358 [Ancylostoma ceylanicum]
MIHTVCTVLWKLVGTNLTSHKSFIIYFQTNSGERIPFNRDVDMGHGGSSKASIEQVKERAGQLSTRFGSKEYL